MSLGFGHDAIARFCGRVAQRVAQRVRPKRLCAHRSSHDGT